MKKIVVAKPFSDRFVGHLYEHMFVFALSRYFRDNKLLAYLDYTIDAKTYHKGLIWLEVSLFSDEAIKLSTAVYKQRITITQDEINHYLLQVMSEKEILVESIDYTAVSKLLHILDSSKWFDSNSSELISNEVYEEAGTIVEIKRTRRSNIFIEQQVSIDTLKLQKKTNLQLPLCIVLSEIIQSTLQEDICRVTRSYSLNNFWAEEKSSLMLINEYSTVKKYFNYNDELNKLASGIISIILAPETIKRVQLLARRNDNILPSMHAIMEYSGRFVGANFWNKEVTAKLVETAIDCISIQFHMYSKGKRR